MLCTVSTNETGKWGIILYTVYIILALHGTGTYGIIAERGKPCQKIESRVNVKKENLTKKEIRIKKVLEEPKKTTPN
jgi:hypothetical protein